MKKADFIVIAVVLSIAVVLIAVLYGSKSNTGSYVQIEVNGKVVNTLSLDEDVQLEIEGADGGTNTLVIENGYASVTHASCPDGICVNHKKINRSGESIICLPNKVVISVVNDKSTDEIDAVS